MYVQLQLVTFFLFCLQGSEQKAVSSASGGATRVVAGSSARMVFIVKVSVIQSSSKCYAASKCYTATLADQLTFFPFC